ncbi:MAG TPA: hypothetical protein VNI57_10650, partial [Candidatus Saccharimonadales bacterium]|nr:hypothetical protein [Candidatus Saccharimonadales bacterium]
MPMMQGPAARRGRRGLRGALVISAAILAAGLAAAASSPKISKRAIATAARVIGLEFTSDEREQ